MKVVGTYEAFKKTWGAHTEHRAPILYTVTPLGRVDRCYPMAHFFYEWVIDGVLPTEGEFLGTYGYAHKVVQVTG